MNIFREFIEALPGISKEPITIVGYIFLLVIWLLAFFRKKKSKDFIKALEKIPVKERTSFAKAAGYNYDRISQLSQKDRLKYLSRKYFFLAYLITLMVILLIILSFIKYTQNENTTLYLIKKIESKNQQLQDSLGVEKNRTDQIIRNVERLYGKALTIAIIEDKWTVRNIASELVVLLNEFDRKGQNDKLSNEEIKKVQVAKETINTLKAISNGVAVDGPFDAEVSVIMFADYQCPFSARANVLLNKLRQKYRGHIKFTYRHYPLPMHPNAIIAAKAAIASSRQGKFWDFHNKIFELQANINEKKLTQIASEVGLDLDWFKRDLKDPEIAKIITTDIEDADLLGIRATPTFFISNKVFTGFNVDFENLINEILLEKKNNS